LFFVKLVISNEETQIKAFSCEDEEDSMEKSDFMTYPKEFCSKYEKHEQIGKVREKLFYDIY